MNDSNKKNSAAKRNLQRKDQQEEVEGDDSIEGGEVSLYKIQIWLFQWIQNLKPKNQKKRNVVTCKLLYGKKKMEEAGVKNW